MTAPVLAPGRARVLAVGPWSTRLHRRYVAVCVALVVGLVLATAAALTLGANTVSLPRALAAVFGEGDRGAELVVAQLRLPRILTGALVGLALGLAGALFQSVTRNPLGSPDVIGFDSGAATGALVAMLFTAGGALATSTGAVLGGALTAAVVFLLVMRHGLAPLRLVLVGIGVGSMLVALNWMLIVNANLYDAQSAAVWLVGNLAGRGWSRLGLLAPVVGGGAVLALLLSRGLAVGELADERAASLGVRPDRLRLAAVGVGVLLASAAVATAGPIQFVALAAPQVARRLTRATGPNLLAAGLTGALLLVVTDLVAREAFQPRQPPVGVLTGLVGGVYLGWLLTREWKKGHA